MKVLSLLGILIMGMETTGVPAEPQIVHGYKVGDKARSFKLKNVDGKMVSLEDYKDAKGFIVIFSCNHCPYVVKYEDRMNDLNKKYAPKGFPVIAINSNDDVSHPEDSFDKMVERHKDKKFTFPYLRDDTQEIAKAYGAEKTPHVYVLQKSGTDYIVRYIGAIDDNATNPKAVKEKYVENAVDALLAGKEVKVTETKAVGCSIKWKKS
ncbi:MAG: thioredoxin family protein [Bacteroidia bacterium]|nr:thioredoxin family protein [Bacteroidia bacterium]MDW8334175.1 thioredoxin family protein [Bacteroidia bacterium]